MLTQTLLDSFYELLLLVGLMHMMSGRALHHVILMWNPAMSATPVTQRSRYLTAFIGLLSSCGALAVLVWSFSPMEIYIGLNELWNARWFLGLLGWIAVALHAVTIVVMLIAAAVFYRNPSIYGKKVRGKYISNGRPGVHQPNRLMME